MSLAIVFKGTEGIVLAVDSRVTLTATAQSLPGIPTTLVHSTFDNATKLLRLDSQEYVGAVTYGIGAIGQKSPRTAHSFMPEFEEELLKAKCERLAVKDFAERLGQFFLRKWAEEGMPAVASPLQNMEFIVGGFDEGEPYGRVYGLQVPTGPTPQEWHIGEFGVVWGGQSEFVHRLISGYDPSLFHVAQEFLKCSDQQRNELHEYVNGKVQASIPFPFLPLQDCVNLAILLIRATMTIQTFTVGVRGVGGPIDVVTITRTDGFRRIQLKEIAGETIK